jgi:hypothetical protein
VRFVAPLALAAIALAQEPPAEPAPPTEPPPHAVEMRGGSMLVGRIEPSTWKVKTDFGELLVPVAEIRRVRFGRRAQPERLARVEQALKDLAGGNPDRRDHARAAIHAEGAFAALSLRRVAKEDLDPEVRRIAGEILVEMELAEEQILPDDDLVDTTRFSLRGEVDLAAFKVHVTELGPLVVRRSDVAQMRSFAPDSARRLTVGGTQVWPNGWLDTKIKVEKGEPLKITATGTIFFPNWGQACTPDGNPNMGAMNNMMLGTLAGRIGDKGTLFRIGSNYASAAPASGTLQLIVNINAPDQPHDGEYVVVVSRGTE